MRTFAYLRVSREDLNADNQITAIRNGGYDIPDNRVIEDTVSGTVHALKRPKFSELINIRMEAGDCLVVVRLDRIGRDANDILNTVRLLEQKGIVFVSLDMPFKDMNSSAGKMMLHLLALFADFEREMISERTREGIARAKAQGKKLGRKPSYELNCKIQQCKRAGMKKMQVVKLTGTSLSTVRRHWNTVIPPPE